MLIMWRQMMMSDTLQRVRKLVAREWNVDEAEVGLDTSFEAMGRDSLEHTELMMALEEEFGIDITDEDAPRMKTVADAVAYIEKKMSS